MNQGQRIRYCIKKHLLYLRDKEGRKDGGKEEGREGGGGEEGGNEVE